MSMVVKIGSIVKLYTILLLMKKPQHGYEIMKELEKKTGKKISPSQVYPFLELLEKENIIVVNKTGKREKIVYNITKEGKKFADDIFSRAGNLFQTALKQKINACIHCGCKVFDGGYKKNGKMFCCEHCAKSFMQH